MSVKATECSELSGVMLKPVFLNPLLATAALFDILPLNLYLSWGVSKLLELQLMLEGYRITLPGLTKKLYKQFMILKKIVLFIITLLNAWCWSQENYKRANNLSLTQTYDISRQALFLFTRSVWRNDLWVNLHLTPYNLN